MNLKPLENDDIEQKSDVETLAGYAGRNAEATLYVETKLSSKYALPGLGAASRLLEVHPFGEFGTLPRRSQLSQSL